MNPQSIKDFDRFLDSLPLNVGYNAIIAASIAWILAGAAVVFASVEAGKVSKLRSDLLAIEALKPPIPQMEYNNVSKPILETLVKKMEKLYPGVGIIVNGDGGITISGSAVSYYPQFRAAIGHIVNGGRLWRVNVNKICVGRECKGPSLQAELNVSMARVSEPTQAPSVAPTP